MEVSPNAAPSSLAGTLTLADLPGHEIAIDAEAPVHDFAALIQERPELPGVLIRRGGTIHTLLSRRQFTDRMSRPFFLEAFKHRSIDRLLRLLETKVLRLPETTPVPAAMEAALARPRADAYEPVLVEGRRIRLVDIHSVFLGQSEELRRQIEAHQLAVEIARQAEDRYRGLFEDSLEGLYVTSPQGVILRGNPSLARILGYGSVAELLRDRAVLGEEFFVTPGRREQFTERLLRDGRVVGLESMLARKDGERIWVLESARLVTSADGLPVQIEGSLLDITERIRRDRYRQAMEAAKAASRAQSEFLASISHEIRTPLHSILSFANFGSKKLESAPPAKLARYFRQIETNGAVLLELVNDLLDLAKFEAGRMQLELAACNLSLILSGIADEFMSVLAEREIRITFTSRPELVEAVCDARRIMQVVRNLVSNAIKFSPEGGEIRIELTREGDRARVRVRDDGVGIPEEELEAIFDKFRQSSRTGTGAGGTGLGLAICRQIVEAHGGEIHAENRQSGGAQFVFTIPVAAAVLTESR